MEPEMKNENEAPKPGTKDALKQENAALEVEVAQLKAQLAAMEKAKLGDTESKAEPAPEKKEEEKNNIDRDRLGFDENSFKGEPYHGKKRKNTVDAVAASLILEGYLAFLKR